MLPQYWLEVRAILLRNDDRLISIACAAKIEYEDPGVISAAIWRVLLLFRKRFMFAALIIGKGLAVAGGGLGDCVRRAV